MKRKKSMSESKWKLEIHRWKDQVKEPLESFWSPHFIALHFPLFWNCKKKHFCSHNKTLFKCVHYPSIVWDWVILLVCVKLLYVQSHVENGLIIVVELVFWQLLQSHSSHLSLGDCRRILALKGKVHVISNSRFIKLKCLPLLPPRCNCINQQPPSHILLLPDFPLFTMLFLFHFHFTAVNCKFHENRNIVVRRYKAGKWERENIYFRYDYISHCVCSFVADSFVPFFYALTASWCIKHLQ